MERDITSSDWTTVERKALSELAIAAERAAILSKLLDFAYGELFWISEYPNRAATTGRPYGDNAMSLAERARDACSQIETGDPDNHL